jgi:hypothetical protein
MFPLIFDDTTRIVEKIKQENFTPYHHEVIGNLQYESKKLFFKDKAWSSILLGAGEEKAVYCICDHNNKVFALEIIDEKHYLNGRLINGEYFFQKRIGNLVDVKFNPQSLIGLTFTGLVKAREFIYGYEWGRFQLRYDKESKIDKLLTFIFQAKFISEFNSYAERYKDVHDRNVMFEIKGKSDKGALIFYIDSNKKLKIGKLLIRAIDVR